MSQQRLIPCPDLDAGSGQCVLEFGIAVRIADHGECDERHHPGLDARGSVPGEIEHRLEHGREHDAASRVEHRRVADHHVTGSLNL